MDNLQGVETFGAARRGGKKVNPMWGAVIGAGGGTVTAVAVRQVVNPLKHPKLYAYSEALGLGVGALSGAAMLLLGKKKWAAAGWTALASAFLNNGIRQLELMLFKAPGLGIVDVEPATALLGQGTGMGDAVIEPSTVLQGSFEASQDMPQLVGATLAQANAHVQGIGAPALSEHAANWGATLFAR